MNMKKLVIGCGGGKALSIALHNKTGLPLYHLDMINGSIKPQCQKKYFSKG